MYQIIFNTISASEMSQLSTPLQLELLAGFQLIPEDPEKAGSEKFGVVEREGKKLYRFRIGEYRIYFEKTSEGVLVHRVLSRNTIRDFLFRTKLPMSEDDQVGKAKEFWKLIEEGEGASKR